MRQLIGLFITAILGLSGCEDGLQSGCGAVSERIYINDRYPSQIDQYNPDSMRVFMFESSFDDNISVLAGHKVLARKHMKTESAGLAGRVLIRASPNEDIIITTSNGCAHFRLKEGYKYLYINRLNDKNWTIAYSNYSRAYF